MKRIWVAGDFFLDEFNIGKYRGNGPRFLVDETIRVGGGASNTLRNARAICDDDQLGIQVRAVGHSLPKILKRWIVDGKTVLEVWEKVGMDPPTFWNTWNRERNRCHPPDFEWQTLIVSEYNKGFSQGKIPDHPELDLLIVDSRYRTAPMEQLRKLARTAIWRCTGDEYDAEYAKHFDYVVHTSHGGEIRVLAHGRYQYSIMPDSIQVVDPCGAGDTFTAALAAYITANVDSRIKIQAVNARLIGRAICFAIKAAQNVCKKPYTAVTDVKLEKR